MPGVVDRLNTLINLRHTRTVIVSGRSLSELDKLINIPEKLELWGSHGLERKCADGRIISSPVNDKYLEGLNLGKQACLQYIPHEYCEIKPYAVALHWRGLDPIKLNHSKKKIEEAWSKISTEYDFEVHYFDGGIEFRPQGNTKGNVIQQLLQEQNDYIAIAYLGDDMTDEEAFNALGNKGLKVLVRNDLRPTLADIFLHPPEELLAFLDTWIGAK